MRGFSLVELSIVLVILGLLVGGILAGQSLIRAGELRAVSTEYSRIQTAIGAFRDKYMALPGDMTNATSFWPGQTNGNGDGNLGDGNATQRNETFQAWQELAIAGLWEGTYSGSGTTSAIIGSNIPGSKLPGAGWNFDQPQSTWAYSTISGNILNLGAMRPNNNPLNAIIRPEEAWNLDTKLDDGKPAYGKLTAVKYGFNGAPNCTTSPTPAASTYALSTNSIECSLVFALGY